MQSTKNKKESNSLVSQKFDFDYLIKQEIEKLIDNVEEDVDVITFCEDPYYLGQPLHPVEKVILKVFYGVKLDDVIPTIQAKHFPNDEKGKWFTEKQYIEFLIRQQRINVDNFEELCSSQELVLVCGRRSGKTFLASI
ncbi:MAG: hypothetical protein WC934_13880, partial [Acidithiobacillus sp.]|uniref:hypothetical protein n=1 Tax=Acidithiobacillus sp. TaxID=1872118 RepID=UPI00355CF9F0